MIGFGKRASGATNSDDWNSAAVTDIQLRVEVRTIDSAAAIVLSLVSEYQNRDDLGTSRLLTPRDEIKSRCHFR